MGANRTALTPTQAGTDRDIDALWLSGHPEALEQAHRRYRSRLEAVAFRILRNQADAEDVVQKVFLAVRNASFKGQASLWTYLYRAAVNGSVNVIRSKKRRDSFEQKLYQEQLVAPTHTARINPEAQVLEGEVMAAVAAALLKVKPQHRRVLTLRIIHGFTNTEIAEREKLPLATVGTWLRRGRIELQRGLRPLLREMGRDLS